MAGCGTQVRGLDATAWDQVVVADPADALVVDARPRAAYDAGHIPGAVHLHWTSLTGPDSNGLWDVLPADTLARTFDERGIVIDHPVVVVGSGPLGSGDDGNVYWALRYLGHPDVRILNGGHLAWMSRGGAVSTQAPASPSTTSDWRVAAPLQATSDDVDAWPGTVLDVRSSTEYDRGHIPGAVWFEWTDVFDGELIARPEVVQDRLSRAGVALDTPVVTTCRSGIRAGHTFMILEALGVPDAANYVGSWRRWVAEGRPVER